jgi:tetratricopeptide (TPR) repeat protein
MRLPGIDPDDLIRELSEAIPQQSGANAEKDRPTPPELEAAVAHLDVHQYEAAFTAAVQFVQSSEKDLRSDANRICGLASSRLGRWNDAVNYWDALFDDEPSAFNALQVASSLAMAGAIDQGKLWLERAKTLNEVSKELPGFTIQTNFITALTQSGQMLAAMPYLEEIRQFYIAFGITDPTILFANRHPFFETFLNNSVPIIRTVLDATEGRAWYLAILPHLDDRGKTELSEWMKEQFQAA